MEAESKFIELVAEVLNHPEFDLGFVINGLRDVCIEKMAKDSDEDSAKLWILLTQAKKLLKED
jgi:hypothetical protein